MASTPQKSTRTHQAGNMNDTFKAKQGKLEYYKTEKKNGEKEKRSPKHDRRKRQEPKRLGEKR
jgi:hypothetical protein